MFPCTQVTGLPEWEGLCVTHPAPPGAQMTDAGWAVCPQGADRSVFCHTSFQVTLKRTKEETMTLLAQGNSLQAAGACS